jgi:hypothetical protein
MDDLLLLLNTVSAAPPAPGLTCIWADTLAIDGTTHTMDSAKTWAEADSGCDLICYMFDLT